MAHTYTPEQAVALLALAGREDLEEHEKWRESFLVLHPEYQDEVTMVDGNYYYSVPMAKAYVRWMRAIGVGDNEKARLALEFFTSLGGDASIELLPED